MGVLLVLKELETERLLLNPGSNRRDNAPFIRMLTDDGDFRDFSGVDPTETNIMMFENYFEKDSCYYAIFEKDSLEQEMIGYVGIGYQKQHYEVEFYISKSYRNRGYCTEALKMLIDEAFKGNLMWRDGCGKETYLSIREIHATTISSNIPTVRVLEKCGFIKTPEAAFIFRIFIDPETKDVYENDVTEYLLKAPAEDKTVL